MIKWFKRKKKDKTDIADSGTDGVEARREGEAGAAESEDGGTDVGMSPFSGEEHAPPDARTGAAAADTDAGVAVPEAEEALEAGIYQDVVSHIEAIEDRLDEEVREVPEEEEREKRRFFKRLRERMQKTREHFTDRVDRLVLGKKVIDADLMDNLEEIMITSDLGVRTTQLLLGRVSEKVKRKELSDPHKLRGQLRDETREIVDVPSHPWDPRAKRPFVIMVIGVNGVGKTTTTGKLAHKLKLSGLNVMLVAADTFRAAAMEQLTLWGERAGVPVIRQKSGSDPSAVAFDGMEAALARDADVVLLDTAGRMHTKVNLMEELKKIQRVIKKKIPDAPHEVLLVLDATTGQNALSQARMFKDELGITGLILTKLDGTARGGVVVSICDELEVPVRYIGIGESMEDLRPFDPEEFTRALF